MVKDEQGNLKDFLKLCWDLFGMEVIICSKLGKIYDYL